MHELSLVLGIIEIASEEAKKAHARRVERIELEIGELANLEMDSFQFAISHACRGTVLEDAEWSIDSIPGKAVCPVCSHSFPASRNFDPCPLCGNPVTRLIQGKELRVRALSVGMV